MSKTQTQSLLHKKPSSTKKFWLITLCVVLGVVGITIGKSLYDTYSDRPLAKGLEFIGREYNSGCAPFRILCYGPESEFLFYATEINPDEVINLFPGWKVEKVGEENIPIPSYMGKARYYVLRSEDNHKSAGFAYFFNTNAVRADFKLLPNQKTSTLRFDRASYEALRQANT
jgi:hypothetical protein